MGFRGAFGQRLQIPVTASSPNYEELVVPPLGCSRVGRRRNRFSMRGTEMRAHRSILNVAVFNPNQQLRKKNFKIKPKISILPKKIKALRTKCDVFKDFVSRKGRQKSFYKEMNLTCSLATRPMSQPARWRARAATLGCFRSGIAANFIITLQGSTPQEDPSSPCLRNCPSLEPSDNRINQPGKGFPKQGCC